MANYTQKAIMNEFEKMLTEMPFSKITVSALVTRCAISSNTFYYHFRDIYDLLDTWLDIKKISFLKEIGNNKKWESILKEFLCALQNNPKLVYHISDSISRERLERYVFVSVKSFFYDYLKKTQLGSELKEDILKGLSDFCCYFFLGLTLEFIWGHMESNVDDAIERISTIFNGVLENIVQKSIISCTAKPT